MLTTILIALVGATTSPYVATGAEPVAMPHFPSALHAYVWRNWMLVPMERLAEAIDAKPDDLVALGQRMGLSGPPEVTWERFGRSHISVIRTNWHLLPDDQMLKLLGWTPERYAFALREDDFLYGKLGVRPDLKPLVYETPSMAIRAREEAISEVVKANFPAGAGVPEEPLFGFVDRLSAPVEDLQSAPPSQFSPRFSYSYFAVYGDALLESDPFPEGMLARLAESGVEGVWLQAVLYKLAPLPWHSELSKDYEKRLANLKTLTERARKYGIGVYLYLNEPRSMPLDFFTGLEHLKGVEEAGYGRLCTSTPEVQNYIRDSVARICTAAPDLAGFFTITVGENRTLCWSHMNASGCPRCSKRTPSEVVAEVCTVIQEGIDKASSNAALMVWDWAWPEDWFQGIVDRLPAKASLLSVSEWELPIDRGTPVTVSEYSMSAVGPGPRAQRHWAYARARGLKTVAKVQASTTWELSTVPYMPAFRNVAEHMANLRDEGVNGLMLSWTVGAYPSAGYEIVSVMGGVDRPSPEEAMLRVAKRRFGDALAPAVVTAWNAYSEAIKAYPFHNHPLYLGPVQAGPANALWERYTGYRASMVGFPYDDLTRWRAMYSEEAYIGNYGEMSAGFTAATDSLEETARPLTLAPAQTEALTDLRGVARACAIHFKSTANQARFIQLRRSLEEAQRHSAEGEKVEVPAGAAFPTFADRDVLALLAAMEAILRDEQTLARELYALQCTDSRLGFESSNQYHFTPMDLAEKVLNTEDLLTRWIPSERSKNLYAPNWW